MFLFNGRKYHLKCLLRRNCFQKAYEVLVMVSTCMSGFPTKALTMGEIQAHCEERIFISINSISVSFGRPKGNTPVNNSQPLQGLQTQFFYLNSN